MVKDLQEIAVSHGDRVAVIPAEHLKELKDIIEGFKEGEELNDFQEWIVNELYQFDIPETGFAVNSIILAAIHHPFYARAEFINAGVRKTFLSLVRSDFKAAESYIRDFLEAKGCHLAEAGKLPLKRLGVHSGLAKYGRNNVTYIEGMGSNFSYAAYFSDVCCEEDTWGEVKNAALCGSCSRCVENCPTGAIRKERFLIDNQKCLSYFNKRPGDFPVWIPESVHHTLYDCLICQHVCPMNSKQKEYVIGHMAFTEEETGMLLEGKAIDALPEELKEKLFCLGMDEWYGAIPRNLKALFAQPSGAGMTLLTGQSSEQLVL